uniref:Uncharacterized protein n=1 Tax=Solanum lycopersicum TaxID=4081 RepID=A0A3Q7ISV9_SOLLC
MGEKSGFSHQQSAILVWLTWRVGRLDEAHNFSELLGVEGNVLGRWGSFLAACRVHRNFDMGKIVSKEGNWQSVDNVRRGIHKVGLSKEVVFSWIDTSGYPHCFVSKDRKHPQYYMIYDVLGYLTINMKDAGAWL